MSYERTPEQAAAQEALQRQAEAATQALAPIANAATERLHALAAD